MIDTELTVLKAGQIRLAEWLATPIVERQPKTQKELAMQLGVSEATLCNWKQDPEIWEYRDKLLRQAGKDKVPDAIKKVGDLMDCENKKVELEAAKDILSRWSDPRKSAHIITTLKELYQLHDKENL
jgi:hypothetical protein